MSVQESSRIDAIFTAKAFLWTGKDTNVLLGGKSFFLVYNNTHISFRMYSTVSGRSKQALRHFFFFLRRIYEGV
jgi:hypothetical protein